MELFDNHAHYNDEKFDDDRDEIIKKIYDSGVTKLISAGYSLASSIQKNMTSYTQLQVFPLMIYLVVYKMRI